MKTKGYEEKGASLRRETQAAHSVLDKRTIEGLCFESLAQTEAKRQRGLGSPGGRGARGNRSTPDQEATRKLLYRSTRKRAQLERGVKF